MYSQRIKLCPIPSVFMAGHASAGIYSPAGFHDVEHYQLHNGLHVILKRRGDVRDVAIRVEVGVDTLHFPCSIREATHFLEHLLFTGTSQHTEAELDGIANHGGTWNAETVLYQPIHKVDIFSRHFDVGLTSAFEAYAN